MQILNIAGLVLLTSVPVSLLSGLHLARVDRRRKPLESRRASAPVHAVATSVATSARGNTREPTSLPVSPGFSGAYLSSPAGAGGFHWASGDERLLLSPA